MHAPTVAEVSLGALARNVEVLRRAADGRPLMAVVKADAYGHGAVPVSRRLVELGVDRLAVATLPEALELRKAGVGARILVFGAPLPQDLPAFCDADVEVTVSSEPLLEAVLRAEVPLKAHLKVDTGMTRLGLAPREAAGALHRLERSRHVALEGVCTHFAASDAPGDPATQVQLDRWQSFLDAAGPLPCPTHLAASGGVLSSPQVLEASDIIRPGIALYGLYETASPLTEALEPVMCLRSRVARVVHVPRGTPVSYGGRWTAPADTRIATVAAGYADGLPRRTGGQAEVLVAGKRAPVVGTVCMDMCMVHLPDRDHAVEVGDPVVLFGGPGPSCGEWAAWAETITYEIVCGISRRVRRSYV